MAVGDFFRRADGIFKLLRADTRSAWIKPPGCPPVLEVPVLVTVMDFMLPGAPATPICAWIEAYVGVAVIDHGVGLNGQARADALNLL